MAEEIKAVQPRPAEARMFFALFAAGLCFNLWAVQVGWESRNLPGLEFRQAQTAISAHYIQQNHDFSLAYPTPVLGKPWSIPMEFPLYQWTVVVVGNWTGLDLTKAGRVVSLACFYLSLPAVFLLLGRMGVAVARRWLVLAIVVTCPLYIFYSRAFLMETMALMFSLWFWMGFERTVETRNARWLAVALLAGSGAGLVKVTTFILYLLPAGWWALRRLCGGRHDRRWQGDIVWMVLAVALPFALTLGWLNFSDATKALNPSAQFLRESNLRFFTLGTWADHFSPELWRQKWVTISEQLSWGPLLGGAAIVGLLAARRRGGDILRLLLWFTAVQLIFPVLYARHEYYFIANAVLLLMAVGLVLAGLAESGRPLWLVTLVALTLAGGQAYRYLDGYYRAQRGISSGGDGLTRSLKGLTGRDEVLLIAGQDWNAMTPYYAERRALMIRSDAEQDEAQLDAAFTALAGEKIGALVLGPDTTGRGRENLLRRAVAQGIDPQPLYRWQGGAVHLPLARRSQSIRNMVETGYGELSLEPGVELPANPLAGAWFETQSLRPRQRMIFATMHPQPVRFFSTFGPVLDGSSKAPQFGAHPVTRLVYRLPAGTHTLRTTACFAPDAYSAALPEGESTDGVEITLAVLGSGDERRVLLTRWLDPRGQPEDRGVQLIKTSFVLEEAADVELFIGPGPFENNARDWVWLGRLVFD